MRAKWQGLPMSGESHAAEVGAAPDEGECPGSLRFALAGLGFASSMRGRATTSVRPFIGVPFSRADI